VATCSTANTLHQRQKQRPSFTDHGQKYHAGNQPMSTTNTLPPASKATTSFHRPRPKTPWWKPANGAVYQQKADRLSANSIETIWTPEIVDTRQKELLEKLERHWRLADRKNPISEITASLTISGDGTWRDDVHESLRRIGGHASLDRIYKEVELLRRSAGRSIPPSLEAVVRRTLEEHSTDSAVYKGGADLFYMPEGEGPTADM
jgi:hypothetical protein